MVQIPPNGVHGNVSTNLGFPSISNAKFAFIYSCVPKMTSRSAVYFFSVAVHKTKYAIISTAFDTLAMNFDMSFRKADILYFCSSLFDLIT